jgi:putative membrane protein
MRPRRWFLLNALLILAGVWLGVLPLLAQQSFFAHMVMHVAVVAVAAPLLALAMAQTRFDPLRHTPALFTPIAVSLFELVVVWGWHAPALHHAARQSLSLLLLEQLSFLLAGLLLWLSVLGGDPDQRAARAATGVVALLLTSMHMTLLGALLALAPRALYEHSGGLWQMSALQDQQLGGVVMLLVGGVVYLSGGLYLLAELLRSPPVPGNVEINRVGEI